MTTDDHWGNDKQFPVEDWQYEVANDDTRLGYWDWVRHQREMSQDDERKYLKRVNLVFRVPGVTMEWCGTIDVPVDCSREQIMQWANDVYHSLDAADFVVGTWGEPTIGFELADDGDVSGVPDYYVSMGTACRTRA